jgi:DNA-binding beta-propeller fold protein YncE
MDAGPDGLVHVPNSTSGEVLVLNAAGHVVRRWGLTETGKRQLDCWRNPSSRRDDLCGVAITEDGTAFVAESGADRVSRFPTGGEQDLTWGTSGTKDGAFQEPIGVDVGPDARVYVVDDVRDDIQVFSADGAYVRTIGMHGTEPGQMSFTGMVRVRDDGTVVNADFDNARVQAFSPVGKLQWWFGSYGSGPGEFVEPQDIAFGPDGLLFVMDAGRVQVFDRSHEMVGAWPADGEWHDHLGSIALVGNSLWVEPSYTGTLLRVPVSYS